MSLLRGCRRFLNRSFSPLFTSYRCFSVAPGVHPVVEISLQITDPDVVAALNDRASVEDKHAYALSALKIGVIALQSAGISLDATTIRKEGQFLLEKMVFLLHENQHSLQEQVERGLKEYFAPTGKFNARITELLQKGGELEQTMLNLIGPRSEMIQRLCTLMGEDSILMKRLSPERKDSILGAIQLLVESELDRQKSALLREFSLDHKSSALSRLVSELEKINQDLNASVDQRLTRIASEFSFDKADSALSRMVRNLENSHATISKEFSLDNPKSAFSRLHVMLEQTHGAVNHSLSLDHKSSPLARLRLELFELLQESAKENRLFQENVRAIIASKEGAHAAQSANEKQGSPCRGLKFEEAVLQFLTREAQKLGDVAIHTGAVPGLINRCKVGDIILQLSPDSAAADAKICVEVKDHASVSLASAREEIEIGRQNRGAQVGLYVFSGKQQLPLGLEDQPFTRIGNDIFVVWDSSDSLTDVYLLAAMSTARALCVRSARNESVSKQILTPEDFDELTSAILLIEKRIEKLTQITTWTKTIISNGEKILKQVRDTEKAVLDKIEVLNEKTGLVRAANHFTDPKAS